ncbi:MAG: TIGR01212 family radical SAM protein [Erysipelotrichaceae bacterium]|nr:TIGR01212 family radical SAM protein [Erysipelotrichaceae bacterium]
MENNFRYSFNEKRYHTFNYYLKTHYNGKVAKVIIDAGFTCPNRDGSKAYGGCIFCSSKGSGDSNVSLSDSVLKQYSDNKEVMDLKWENSFYIPYFQSYSNTYGPLDRIKEMIEPFIHMDEVAEIAIATRCDCLSDEIIEYLNEVCKYKPVWLELGLQTSNDRTGEYINRQYTYNDFKEAVYRLKETDIKVCAHIINGLPYETMEIMLKTVKDISVLPLDGVKIHMLHIIKGTKLAEFYKDRPFNIISREEYIELVVEQLRYLKPEIVIQRLTGDPLKEDLIAPEWVLNKTTILNDIDKLMRKKDVYQGDLYHE